MVSKDGDLAPRPLECFSIFAGNTDENRYLEWFKCRTVIKIPGPFVLTFWDTLLFQASWNEPAVLHAILTLSSIHKREISDGNSQSRSDGLPDEQEQFMLQHYNRAIHHLQPHFSAKDRASVRVALITCAVFIGLEFLRGNFETAQTYLRSGLDVLRESQIPSNVEDGIFLLKPSHDSIDSFIVEAFFRLHVQVELFKQSYQHPYLVLLAYGPEARIFIFHSVNEAWHRLELLLNEVFQAIEQGRQQQAYNNNLVWIGYSSALLGHQQHIQAELARWLDTYEASRTCLQSQDFGRFVCMLLLEYHTLASIMADTCLRLDDESIFDSYTEQFIFIVNQSANMWVTRSLGSRLALPGNQIDMSRSLIDLGWIPPLYYTALKCRVHRVRLQAIRLLESTSHREGVWDSKIAACVARKIMELEEGEFYTDLDMVDDFPLSSSPGLQDLSTPTLPESHRIREVKVVLSNGPVFVSYRGRKASKEWKDIQVSIQSRG